MMTILSWLFAGVAARQRDLSRVEKEIEEKSKSVQEMDKSIDAVRPHVQEAIKRTDDVYYKLRSKVKTAERRIEKTETDLFIRDLESGWRKKDDR